MHLRQARLIIAVLTVALAAGGCGNSASTATSITAPAGVRCQASITNSSGSFGPAGGTGTVRIGVSRDCSWSAQSQASWLVITSAAEGQGEGAVTYRVSENGEPVARQGALIVSDQQVAVSQGAAPCRFDVSPSSTGPVAAQGGEIQVGLRTHDVCSWTAQSQVAWASVTPGSGRGTAGVRVSVQPNPGGQRPIAVTIAGQPLSVPQLAAPAPPPPPPPAPNPPAPTPPAPPAPTPPAPPAPTPPAPPAPTPPAPTPPAPPAPPPPPPTPPPAPVPVREIELEGRVTELSGACPALTFKIRGLTVYTNSDTDFDRRCSDVRNGREVEVEGMLMSDGTVRADKVEKD